MRIPDKLFLLSALALHACSPVQATITPIERTPTPMPSPTPESFIEAGIIDIGPNSDWITIPFAFHNKMGDYGIQLNTANFLEMLTRYEIPNESSNRIDVWLVQGNLKSGELEGVEAHGNYIFLSGNKIVELTEDITNGSAMDPYNEYMLSAVFSIKFVYGMALHAEEAGLLDPGSADDILFRYIEDLNKQNGFLVGRMFFIPPQYLPETQAN